MNHKTVTPYALRDITRDEFEKWISSYIGSSHLEHHSCNDNEYRDDITQFMWEAWQASRCTLCVELPKPWAFATLTSVTDVLAASDVRQSLDEAGVSYK